jgi:hypothetical protein
MIERPRLLGVERNILRVPGEVVRRKNPSKHWRLRFELKAHKTTRADWPDQSLPLGRPPGTLINPVG